MKSRHGLLLLFLLNIFGCKNDELVTIPTQPVPEIINVSPLTMMQNARFTVTGKNFDTSITHTEAFLDSVPLPVISVSPTTIVAAAPDSVMSGRLSVKNNGHRVLGPVLTIIRDTTFEIIGASRTNAYLLDTILLTVARIDPAKKNYTVFLGSKQVPIDSIYGSTVKFTIPIDAVSGNVSLASNGITMTGPTITVARRWKVLKEYSLPFIPSRPIIMPDGSIFFCGGIVYTSPFIGKPVVSDGIYGYSAENDQWLSGGTMTERRTSHGYTVLKDGNILIVGGQNLGETGTGPYISSKTFEIRNAATGAVVRSGPLNRPWVNFFIATLPGGKVLLIKLRYTDASSDVDSIPACEIFDPGTYTFRSVDSSITSGNVVQSTDGTVIVFGNDGFAAFDENSEHWTKIGYSNPRPGMFEYFIPWDKDRVFTFPRNSSEPSGIFTISTRQWKRVNRANEQYGTITGILPLSSSSVMVIGGGGSRSEIYDDAAGIWRTAEPTYYSYPDAAWAIEVDGKFLVFGGNYINGLSKKCEIYTPAR